MGDLSDGDIIGFTILNVVLDDLEYGDIYSHHGQMHTVQAVRPHPNGEDRIVETVRGDLFELGAGTTVSVFVDSVE